MRQPLEGWKAPEETLSSKQQQRWRGVFPSLWGAGRFHPDLVVVAGLGSGPDWNPWEKLENWGHDKTQQQVVGLFDRAIEQLEKAIEQIEKAGAGGVQPLPASRGYRKQHLKPENEETMKIWTTDLELPTNPGGARIPSAG